jgi:hypothetical protein
MKWSIQPQFRLLLAVSLLIPKLSLFAQDSTQLQVISPFDSVSLSDVKAIGNLETGSVQITMQVLNKYHKVAIINIGGAAFDDLGLTDDRGTRYKYFSYSGPPGLTQGHNKGFSQITDMALGKSKVQMFIYVQDTLHVDQSETLKFRLVKVDKSVKTIKEAHLLCTLTLDYMSAGQKQFYIKNIPVEWVKPKPKVAGKG